MENFEIEYIYARIVIKTTGICISRHLDDARVHVRGVFKILVYYDILANIFSFILLYLLLNNWCI